MKTNRIFIFAIILVLMSATLACGLFGGGPEPAGEESPATEDAPLEEAAPEEPAEAQPAGEAPAAQPPGNILLGEEYRSEEGGYAFHPIPEYELEEFFGLATMVAPDGDPDLGPMVLLIGSTSEETVTTDALFDEFMLDTEDEGVEILDRREISVDGRDGVLAEISGDVDGQQVVGRIVVVAVSPTQEFSLFASAPKDRWNEVAPIFDAVLASIYFFEPQEIDLSESIEELEELEEPAEEEAPEGGEVEIPNFDDFANFPTAYTDLPAGGFVFMLASTTGELPVIVNEGTIQDQSTSAEYVIGLVSDDQQNTITLFIPLDVNPGVLIMTPYDSSSSTKGPGAAIYKGLTLFTNTDGIIMIEAMQDNTISGMFAFTAIDESGNEMAVTGFFNELPLGTP